VAVATAAGDGGGGDGRSWLEWEVGAHLLCLRQRLEWGEDRVCVRGTPNQRDEPRQLCRNRKEDLFVILEWFCERTTSARDVR